MTVSRSSRRLFLELLLLVPSLRTVFPAALLRGCPARMRGLPGAPPSWHTIASGTRERNQSAEIAKALNL
jgi:hypothetical protein